jgi:hypothetical protein
MTDRMPIIQAPLNKARKDKFQLILTIPNILKSIDSKNTRENEYINLDSLQFSVYSVNIPDVEVPPVQLHFSGQNYNVTSFDRPPYAAAAVNFAVDNEFKNYWMIFKWLQLLNDPLSSTYGRPEIFKATGGYPKLDPKTLYDYTTNISVIALDEYNNKKAEFKFLNSFATRLGNYSYNYRDSEEIDCSFEFVFNQLEVNLI